MREDTYQSDENDSMKILFMEIYDIFDEVYSWRCDDYEQDEHGNHHEKRRSNRIE